MADYYPLIAKAIAGLDKNTGEARRSLYERARTALVAQLRGVTPPLSESDITRERLALEEAIRKVEAESARKIRNELSGRPDTRLEAKPAAHPLDRPAQSAPARQPAADKAAAPSPGEHKPEPPRAEPAPSTTASELRRRSLRERPMFEKPSLSVGGLKGFRDVVAEAENLGEATAQAGKTAREAYAAVPSPSPEFERIEPHVEPEGLRPRLLKPGAEREPEAPPEAEAPRPSDHGAAQGPEGRDFGAPAEPGRDREFGAPEHGRLREPAARPEGRGIDAVQPEEFTGDDFSPYVDRMRVGEPMGLDHERPSQRDQRRGGGEAETVGGVRPSRGIAKLAVLAALALVAGGVIAWQWQPIKSAVGGLTTLFSSSQPPASREAAPARQKIADRVGESRSSAPSAPIAAVAQRVVLYEEDPSDPAGKQYVGSAVWRSETVSPGPGQPPDMVVRADIEIPDRKMTVKWSLRRNVDKALPASHTIEIIFTLPPDFSHGGIQNIPGILMKQAEQTRGVPLAGLAVKVTTNFFLIGLSSVESDMQRNVQLLKDRAWFDVPVVYNDGRRAILAVEKGTPGERTFEDAFTAWAQK